MWKRCARAILVVKKVGGMPRQAQGPWIHTLLDGQAALALESIDIKDMCRRSARSSSSEYSIGTILCQNVRTCRRKPEGTLFHVDVDFGVWVEQRSCLQHAGTGSLMMCAWRSGRRFLFVHRTGGLMGPLVWRSWKVGSRMKPNIMLSSETTQSLNSWVFWNPLKNVKRSKFLRPGNKPGRR